VILLNINEAIYLAVQGKKQTTQRKKKKRGGYRNFCVCLSANLYIHFVLQELVVEGEVGLLALAPALLKVKVNVCAELILLGDRLGLLVALEPDKVLFVESPRLLFELAGGQIPFFGEGKKMVSNAFLLFHFSILLVGALLKVEDEKQRVDVELLVQLRLVQDGRGDLGVVERGRLGGLGDIVLELVGVHRVGDVCQRSLEETGLLLRSIKQGLGLHGLVRGHEVTQDRRELEKGKRFLF